MNGMGMTYLSITLGIVKMVIEIMLYISLIMLASKGIQALNIYIRKNM